MPSGRTWYPRFALKAVCLEIQVKQSEDLSKEFFFIPHHFFLIVAQYLEFMSCLILLIAVRTSIIPTSQMRKLRPRELK